MCRDVLLHFSDLEFYLLGLEAERQCTTIAGLAHGALNTYFESVYDFEVGDNE